MAVIIPQVITEDKADGAQIIDGGLRFDASKKQYLTRTFSSPTNNIKWTWSGWVKRTNLTTDYRTLFNGANAANNYSSIEFDNADIIRAYLRPSTAGGVTAIRSTSAVYRDISGWYHISVIWDSANVTAADRLQVYVNGTRILNFSSSTDPTSSEASVINSAIGHGIGRQYQYDGYYFDGFMSQIYFIDGQALDPSYFGFTDPLTNTWRPKKLSSSVAFGTNGFYLPFDGNSPIGQDQSGRGNNWTPVNFGGSNTLEKATGALPILNTDGGGKVARVGVRTDSNASSLVLALPLVGIKSDFSNAINSGATEKSITANGAVATSSYSNFYGGSFDCVGNASTKCLDIADSADFAFASGDALTLECWIWMDSTYASTPRGVFQSSQQKTGGLSNSWFLGVYTNNQLLWGMHASPTLSTPNNSIPTNVWTHIAICRDTSNNWTAYINGISQTLSGSVSTTLSKSGTGAMVGQWCDGTSTLRPLNGYIQDFRLYKGTAKYTQNFIPASTDPDILPDTPSGVSYSSNVKKITDGAVAFDGSGDYLSLTDTSNDLDLGGLQASVEFFVYVTDLSATRVILNKGGGDSGTPWNTSNGLEWTFAYVSGGTFYFQYNSAGSVGSITSSLSLGVWTHVAAATDASNNIALFINGIRVGTATNAVTKPTSRTLIRIGQDWVSQTHSGHISNVHFVKGSGAYDPTATTITVPTAPITSVANTKLLCCKSSTSATVFDVSPGTITENGNAVATNFNPFNTDINTVRGQESGYCTWNPLQTNSSITLSNGNLDATSASTSWVTGFATLGVSSGKWYWEGICTLSSNSQALMGIAKSSATLSNYLGSDSYGWCYYTDTSTPVSYKINNGSTSSYGTVYTTGDVIGVALDLNAGTLTFYRNGVSQGSAYTGLSGEFFPAMSVVNSSKWLINFGQKPFKFPPPDGFQPLALANTPRPTIVRPDQYVGVATYTGTGSSGQSITGLNFQSDLIWIKSRTGAYNHRLFDSVRGFGSGKALYVDETTAEGTYSANDGVLTVNKTGWVFSTNGSRVNDSTNYVAWCWKAGGNSNTFNINDIGYSSASAAGLTAGTITPTGASVNTKSGFSIIAFNSGSNGQYTISHGLGISPSLILCKDRDSVLDWQVFHVSATTTVYKYFWLNSTQHLNTDASKVWGDNLPTSTVFGFSTGNNQLANKNIICYCWAEIPGFSKFGTYTGNGSTNFVNVGFRPRWIMIKRTVVNSSPDATSNYSSWTIYDTSRNTYNGQTPNHLYANKNINEGYRGNASDTSSLTDMTVNALSNGFYLSGAGTEINANTGTYVYAAFAEAPSFNLYGGQSNAR